MDGISEYLVNLCNLSHELVPEDLVGLSSMEDQAHDEVEASWCQLPALRRIQVVSLLVEMAEADVELDFTRVLDFAIDDDDPVVRARALSGLWESDDRRFIPRLIYRMREDTDEQVRATAATALGRYALLYSHGKILERDGSRVYDALLEVLSDEDESLSVRRRALESIAAYAVDEVDEWIMWAYDNRELSVQESAVFSMGRTCNAEWLGIVLKELDSEEPSIRYEAANASREIGDEIALPSLAVLMNDSDLQVSTAAMNAVAGIGGAEARKLLRQAIATATDEEIRDAAQEALQLIDGENPDMMFRHL